MAHLLNKLFLLFFVTAYTVSCSTTGTKPQHIPQGLPNNINYSANQLEFVSQQTLGSLGQKWKQGNAVINIAHFGDSHIQPGWQVGPLRDMLQAVKGDAGRGMIFPYAMAKSYSQEDFTSQFTGKWKTSNSIHQPPKIPLGISGFVAKTKERQAQVTFSFKKPRLNPVNARILFRTDNGNYRLLVSNGSETQTVNLQSTGAEQFVDIKLGEIAKNLTLTIQTNDENAEFTLYGIALSNLNRSGVIYHNLGVGGAAYSALLQQALFARHLPLINADLVILDWGTNDLIYTNQIDSQLETTIRQTIRKVRTVNPHTAILLTSVQEANYRGRNITASAQYAALIRKIAKEERTLFYDWYAIAGKQNSINHWRSLGFASKDGIHLNGKGYRVRAKLLGEALLNALQSH